MSSVKQESDMKRVPSLVFSHGKDYRDQTFCTIHDGRYYIKSIPELREITCMASCFGWLLLRRRNSSSNSLKPNSLQCYLFNPVSFTKIHLPPLLHRSFTVAVLTYPPHHPNCVVMFVSSKLKSCIFSRIGDTEWIEEKLTDIFHLIRGPIPIISLHGKIYLFIHQGFFLIDFHDASDSPSLRGWKSSNFFRINATTFASFFLESCGDIFAVTEVRLGSPVDIFTVTEVRLGSPDITQELLVYRLDMGKMNWVKVDNLGDRIFFLSATSTGSQSATELGLKGNCIYISQQECTVLYKYDMDDGSMTTSKPCPDKFGNLDGPFWMLPSCTPQVKKELAKAEEVNDIADGMSSNWKELPIVILELIISCLSPGDSIRFRLTCRSWNSITKPIRPYPLPMQSESESQEIAMLISFPKNKGMCYIHHPINNECYTLNVPELAGATVLHSKYGWLSMSQRSDSIFFFNPITEEIIKLPNHKDKVNISPGHNIVLVSMSFSSPPSSPDCVVFAHIKTGKPCLEFLLYFRKNNTWSHLTFDHAKEKFEPSHCNPIFYNSFFYMLGKDGRLGFLNPLENYLSKWKILPVPAIISAQKVDNYSSYIMENDGDILSIFTSLVGKEVGVYKLDRKKKEWIKLESLGDKVVFLSQATSMVVPATSTGLKGTEDRIYFPKFFNGRDIIYYSRKTCDYCCFWSTSSSANWSETSVPNCSWTRLKM